MLKLYYIRCFIKGLKMIKIAINGIGRIGKLVLKLLLQNKYDIKYLNEINGDTKSLIHSLEFDSIHGKWNGCFVLQLSLIHI